MLDGLAAARLEGADFDSAWSTAWKSIPWGRSGEDWKVALEATREEWQAAYQGRSTATAALMDSTRARLADEVAEAIEMRW